MKSRVISSVLLASVVLAILAAPYLVLGNQSERERQRKHVEQIARLSESQLARLRQNESRYRLSSPQQQAEFHALHDALEKDRQSGTGELNNVLQAYHDWRTSLEHYQREQLDNASTPEARIALMKEIVRARQESPGRPGLRRFGPGGGPQLGEASLAKVMQAIESESSARLSEEQKAELASLQGFPRYIKLLQFLKEASGVNPKPLMVEPPAEFKTVAASIGNYVDDERIVNLIQGQGGASGPGERSGATPDRVRSPEVRLAEVLGISLIRESFRLRRAEQQKVDLSSLQSFLESLPPDRQFELLALEAPDFQSELKTLYLESTGQKVTPGWQDLNELFGFRFGRGGLGPAGGPPGGGEGPGGFRGGFRDNRGRGRIGDDRRMELGPPPRGEFGPPGRPFGPGPIGDGPIGPEPPPPRREEFP